MIHCAPHSVSPLPPSDTVSSNQRNLVAACAAISVFGLAFGMTYPLLSLILESRGVSSAMIGINASMSTLGIVVFSPFIPAISKRVGTRRVALVAAVLTALSMPALKFFSSLEAWFVLRFSRVRPWPYCGRSARPGL